MACTNKPNEVWVVRALCRNKHETIRYKFNSSDMTPDQAKLFLRQRIADRCHDGRLPAQCPTCGSRLWLIETGPLSALEEVEG
jgi:hypothetical protein